LKIQVLIEKRKNHKTQTGSYKALKTQAGSYKALKTQAGSYKALKTQAGSVYSYLVENFNFLINLKKEASPPFPIFPSFIRQV